MSMHEHDDYARDDGGRPPPRPRRDPLGLAALLGPDSDLVPISDYDGALGCSGAAPAAGEPGANRSSACGSCTSHCPSAPLTLEHFQRSRTTEEPS